MGWGKHHGKTHIDIPDAANAFIGRTMGRIFGANREETFGRTMASDQDFVDFLVDQMGPAGRISQRKMFGEYAIYCDGKVVALVCDNQLFVKQTESGRRYIGTPAEAPPYAGAKPYFLIEEAFEDREWIGGLIRETADELPLPKPLKKR